MYAPQLNGAGFIIMNDEGCVLLVKGTSGKWSFPKGQSEPFDTTYLNTAIRESYEEIGLTEGDDYTLLNYTPFLCVDRAYFFACLNQGSEANIKLLDNEITDYRWHNPLTSCYFWGELNIGVRKYIKMLQHSPTL
jgi:8-oxo-dGTP pyrophosphatase MutT (NUDIX family)